MTKEQIKDAIRADKSALVATLDSPDFGISRGGLKFIRSIGDLTQGIDVIIQLSPKDRGDAIVAFDPWVEITYHSIANDIREMGAPDVIAKQRFPMSVISPLKTMRCFATKIDEIPTALFEIGKNAKQYAIPYLNIRCNSDSILRQWSNEPSYITTDSAQVIRIALLTYRRSGPKAALNMLRKCLSSEVKLRRYKSVLNFLSSQSM